MSSSPASLETQKATLRATALAARDALGGERRAAAAQAIARRGLPVEIMPGAVVAGYSPIRSEIDPVPLMRTLAVPGVQLADRKSTRLNFSHVSLSRMPSSA